MTTADLAASLDALLASLPPGEPAPTVERRRRIAQRAYLLDEFNTLLASIPNVSRAERSLDELVGMLPTIDWCGNVPDSVLRDVMGITHALLDVQGPMMAREGGLHETAPRITSAPLRRAVAQFFASIPNYPVVCAELLARLAALCRVLDEGWAGRDSRPLLLALRDEVGRVCAFRPEA